MAEQAVVAVDGGEASDAAVRWVGDRARLRDLVVDITTVIPMDERAVEHPRHEAALRAAREVLQETPARRLVDHTRHGDIVEELVAASREADLLVVGTNRTSGVASLLHLTVPLQLAGKVVCPLVVVPAGWEPQSGPVVVGWQDDGSSDEAVTMAASEAAAAGRELYIVHSWTLPPVDAFDAEGSAALYASVLENQRSVLDRTVRQVRELFPGLKVHSDLTANSADIALARMGGRAGLLVVGSHGGGALADLLRGSVGDELIRAMAGPVMIVPMPDREPIEVYPVTADEEP